MILLFARQVTCLGPVHVIVLGIIGGAIMSQQKELGKLLLFITVVAFMISYFAQDVAIDIVICIVLLLVAILGVLRLKNGS